MDRWGTITLTLTAFFTYNSITLYKIHEVFEESPINFRAPSFLNIFKVLSLKFELSIIRFTETNYHILITFYSFIKVYRIICGSSADKSFIAVYYMLFNVISRFFHMATSLINVFTWNPRLLSRV